MGKSAPDARTRTAVAGIVLIRVFLGLFFLFSGTAKILDLTALTTVDEMPPTIVPGVPGIAAPVAEPPPPPELLNARPFIDELQTATGEDGPFASKDNVLPEYAAFLRETVSAHADIFGWLIIVGETAVGFLLLIGLLTRLAALFAMLLGAAYLLATMHLFPPVGLAANAGFMAMALAVLIGNAGKTAGVDALFGRGKSASKSSDG